MGRTWVVALLALLSGVGADYTCNRVPYNVQSPKVPGDNGYKIKIGGNPDRYVPGEVYTVHLQGWRTQFSVQKFIGFTLSVESSSSGLDSVYGTQSVGTFQLYGDVLTTHSDACPNAVVHTSTLPKSEVQVLWTAPPAGSGCVTFRAMVQESRDVWYMDDGELSRQMCEEVAEMFDLQQEDVLDCCACDEAKYEVTFEGLWSRQTHPKDFPTNEWLTHFSDIIGASHSDDYRVWEYGGFASDGLRQVAEWGSTRVLESELKRKSAHIRTIIKARGLWAPDVNGKTFAVFRVDNKHHLMSLVSMLGPSPDWIVGVSAMELCLKNCSWLDSKTINLYPWDAGTDSGVSYESANQATIPRERITKITNSYPNNEQSPFFDPRGLPMKPLARLTITRQRVYTKSCSDTSAFPDELSGVHYSDEDAYKPECETTPWSDTLPCPVACGKGIRARTRTYVDPMKAKAMGCRRQLEEKEMCVANIPVCEGGTTDDIFGGVNYFDESVCALSSWSPWSTCSVTCGKGFIMRNRHYLDRMGRKKCHEELVQKQMCVASPMECPDEPEVENSDPLCAMTQWSEWSPCSVTCGTGAQARTRVFLVPYSNQDKCGMETMQKRSCQGNFGDCTIDESEAEEVCTQRLEVGPCRGYFPRWYYDTQSHRCNQFVYGGCRGNRNNFKHYNDCSRLCEIARDETGGVEGNIHQLNSNRTSEQNGRPATPYASHHTAAQPSYHQPQPQPQPHSPSNPRPPPSASQRIQRVNCKVSPWSAWSACSTTCGRGRREKTRQVLVQPANGGRACPRKLVKRKVCRNPRCPDLAYGGLESASLTFDAAYRAAQAPRGAAADSSPDEAFQRQFDGNDNLDCVMGDWSAWSPCTQSCGPDALQQRSRAVVSRARGRGQPCGPRLERRYCTLPPCAKPRLG